MIGVVLNERYKIEALIGEGATATVYRALDDRLQRHVAVKVLLPHVHDTTRKRFQAEALSVAKLSHPNIMAVYDVNQDGQYEYLVVELIHGQPLHDFMPASPQDTAEYGRQICQALDYAHKNDVIHRDIKPANIYITSEGTAKIMDFGLAIGRESKRLTAQGTIIGTPAYLSPEQAQGFPLDYRTDIYTTGVVLYELLTGELPFDADDITSILIQQVKKDPIPPSEVMDIDVPQALEDAILRAMEKNPDHRFQTAGEMAAALGSVLGEPMPPDAARETRPAQPAPQVQVEDQTDTLRVVLADDHVILRTSLAMFLNDCPGIRVVGEGSDGDEAYNLVGELQPDVLLLDLNMPRTNGLAILPRLREDFPGVKILVLTGRDENVYIMRALRSGAHGYVLKTIEEKELELAVHNVAGGSMVLGSGVAEKVVAGLSEFEDGTPLNAIQLDVLLCVAAGLEKSEIAQKLGMAVDDVTGHLIKIIDTLNVRTGEDAALLALRAGWISLDSVHKF
ncbi:MAG: protein kinase domain-containing protein [Anaerolineales bacterium]